MSAEDIPQSVVEAAAAGIMPWTNRSASQKHGLVRAIVTRALRQWKSEGYRLVYDPALDPKPGQSFWRDETDEPVCPCGRPGSEAA